MSLSERLGQVSELLIALSASPVPSHQFQTLADYAQLVMRCEYVALCLVDPQEQGYLVHPLVNERRTGVVQRLFRFAEGSVGQVIGSSRLLVVPDVGEYGAGVSDLEGQLLVSGLRSLIIAPLQRGEQCLGALLFGGVSVRYGADDEQVARLVAAGLSSMLETARLYQILSDERSTLAAVFRSSEDAVLAVNLAGVILVANPAVRSMLQIDYEGVAGKPLADAVEHEGLRQLFADKQQAIGEIRLPDGRVAQASLVPVVGEFGEVLGWAAILRDITLLKELAGMKTEFVNTVSHDLKNPITGLKLAADLLGRAGELNVMQEKIRGRLVNTANYMEELVTDLLDLGKIEAGVAMVLTGFDFVGLVEEVVEVSRPGVEDKQITLYCYMPDSLVLTGDKERLRQVLLNLVGNGVKYTPAGGEVSIKVKEMVGDSGRVLINVQVSDTGLGIPPSALPYLFDRFYRVDSHATAGIKGTGLGLAIVKSIIEAHDGSIWVESQEGQGSTFNFLIPLSASAHNLQ